MAAHNELGKLGEELAVDFLKNMARLHDFSYELDFSEKAEIDILAQKEDILAVVEVKHALLSSLDCHKTS